MNRCKLIQILKQNSYAAICHIPKPILNLRSINVGSLQKIKEHLTTLHCYRITHHVIEKLFATNLNVNHLLRQLYNRSDETIHVFYLVVYLLVCMFKNTCDTAKTTIVDVLLQIGRICETETPFHLLVIRIAKQNGPTIQFGSMKLTTKSLTFITGKEVSPDFQSLSKLIRQVNNTEWLPFPKNFHVMKTLCNFALRYRTSNQVLADSRVEMLKSELFYPKAVLDFAYRFRERLIWNNSSRKQCFRALKSILADPFDTNNLSFSQYLINALTFLSDFVCNKILRLNPDGCFCKTKCVRDEQNLETLYSNGLFIICKTCCQPVNYRNPVYHRTHVVNDFHNQGQHFSCIDGCSDFMLVDLYECSIDNSGRISYDFFALLNSNEANKKKHITSICNGDRSCFNLVTVEINDANNVNLSCQWNHSVKQTCFDEIKVLMTDEVDSRLIDGDFLRQNMCFGCLAFCFDICSRKDEVKTKIRNLLGQFYF